MNYAIFRTEPIMTTNDLVEIIKQTISGKEFIDIRLYGGDDYE